MNRYFYYTPWLLQKIGCVIFSIIYFFFIVIEIKGRENLKGLTKPLIIASNHTSEIDVTVLPLALPLFSSLFPVYSVSNPSDRYNTFGWRQYIYGGLFFKMLGGYPIHPGHHNYAFSLKEHQEILKLRNTLFIFPEGKRTPDGSMSAPRGGTGFLIYTMDVDVLPIAIDTFYNFSWKEFLSRKKKITLTILPIMKNKELRTVINPTVDDYRGVSRTILNRISEVMT